MRKLVILSFMTLDGVMQAPGGPEEDPTDGFKQGGWSVTYFDDFLGNVMAEQMGKSFDLLLGRRTYEIFAAHWPYVKGDDPFAAKLNSARKYVVSKTLGKADWSNSVLIKGDVVQEIKKLKEQNAPDLQVHGSGKLIQTLLRHDLVDEFLLKIYPVVLGKGKRLFAEGTVPASFKLIDSKTSPKGVIIATYERAGEVKTGTFTLDFDNRQKQMEAELARRRKLTDESKGR
jgi:dihydrofolate reductase